ncbi:hypothetical protein RB597_004530 [Gaeumannomyces tritici]
MPRPLRSRVAPAKPAPTAEAERAPSAKLRAGPAWDKGSASSSEMSDIYGVSDSELKRISAERNTNAPPAPTTLAAAKAAQRQPQPEPAAKPRADAQQTVALTDSKRRRDTAMSRLDDLTTSSTLEQQPRPQSRGRRASRLSARGGRGASATRETQKRHRADVSGLDIMDDSELFGDLDLDADIDSSSVEGETTAPGYRSADTSSFNIAMFKRGRSRQSSVVGRDDAPIRPSSRGPNTPGFSSTFNLGTFKRRPREHSILGTGRKERAQHTDTEPAPAGDDDAAVDSELESDLELPDIEDESPSRRRTRSSAAAAVVVARDSLPRMDPSPAGVSRKRKSTDAQEGSSKRPALTSGDDVQQSIESESELSPPPLSDSASTPPHIPPTCDDDEDVMAPPASSSVHSNSSPGLWPPLRGIAASRARRGRSKNRRRTPSPVDDDANSDISSPPSLTHSPNYTSARNKGKGRAATAAPRRRSPEKLTTAELTSMLPRRRRRAASNAPEDDEHVMNALAVARGADELAFGGGSRVTRSSKRPTRPLAESNSTSAPKSPNATRGGGSRKGNRRTYGSRGGLAAGSDKEYQSAAAVTGEEENTVTVADESSEAVLDDTFDDTADTVVPPPDLGEELKNAAKKFKEVDKWELEYEEITEPSSPGIDAR